MPNLTTISLIIIFGIDATLLFYIIYNLFKDRAK